LRAAAAVLALLACGPGRAVAAEPEAADAPRRIVSMNLCTDQLLVALADRDRIAAVSHLAADPASAALADAAAGLPITHGVAEEIIALKPDVVLAGIFTTRPTVRLLRRLGYEVVEFAPETSFADMRANILRMGEVIGEPERAAAMAAELDARLAALTQDVDGERPVFATFGVNGYAAGAGTLTADAAEAAGYVALGERLGFSGYRNLSLEQFIVSDPDAVALQPPTVEAEALASQYLRHPALDAFLADRDVLDIPDTLWVCGTMRTLEAVQALIDARAARIALEEAGE
jgi:iron complex transport system substrate-binding protein